MSSHIKSCFISAPAGSNLDILRQELTKRGIRIAAPSELATGPAWSTDITKLLSHVDLVIGVLTRDRRSDSSLFELGQAWALKRRIVIFATARGGSILPFDLKGVLTVRASLRNREAIEFALDQLLAAPERSQQPEAPLEAGESLGNRTDSLLLEARDAISHGKELELERIVERALRQAGVEALATEPASNSRADLAIWSDDLQFSLGNPLLVEVKTLISGRQQARRAGARLSEQVVSSGTRWGLLLYGESSTLKALAQSMPPNVLAISVTELFERMRFEPFAKIVIDLRNRRVHGVAD